MTKALFAALPLSAALAVTPLLAAPATTTRDFMTTSFETLTLEGDIAATLTHDATAKITATGAAVDIDRVTITRNGRSIRISMKQSLGNTYTRQGPVNLALQSADVESITLNGNAVLAVDRLEQQELRFNLGGPSVLTIGSATADDLKIYMAGNGSTTIGGGKVAKADVTMDGAGRLSMAGLSADTVILTSTGPTSIDARAERDATVRAFGTGSIRISGGAPCRIVYAAQAVVECGGGYRE